MIFRRSLILFALIVLAGCGAPSEPTTAPADPTSAPPATSPPEATEAPAPTATSVPATATSEPPTATTEPEPTAVTETVTFTFVNELGTIEEADPIHATVEGREGIIGTFGSETTITITFDPEILTVDDIVALMSEIGSPVQTP